MAEIINPIESVKQISNKEDAKNAAIRAVETIKEDVDKKRIDVLKSLQEIVNFGPTNGSFEDFALMLGLPDEHFVVLAPVFLEELEKSYHNINDQMEMVQIMNAAGIKAEDARVEYIQLCENIDTQIGDALSQPKKDFIKTILGLTYNAVAEAEGIAKKTITIPIEYCHENGKMPAYAHLTDAGMDVFALEDITIMPGETKLIPLGIKVAIPMGYELQVRPKSGRCLNTKLRIANTPGTIDAGYRNEICVIVDNIDQVIRSAKIDENGRLYDIVWGQSYSIGKGEKIAQLVLSEVPKALFYEVENVCEIPNDGRAGGFGSSGLK
jgi:dUTP pyrophosphatase